MKKILIIAIVLVFGLAAAWLVFQPDEPEEGTVATVSDVVVDTDNETDTNSIGGENLTAVFASGESLADQEGFVTFGITEDTAIVYRTGNKVGVGEASHYGTINIVEDELVLSQTADGTLDVQGQFVIDMTNLTVTDLEGAAADSLASSLYDRFNVEQYPTATFDLISYNADQQILLGNLTMNGVTKQIEIPNVMVQALGGMGSEIRLFASTEFNIDRTNWDVTDGIPAVSKFMQLGLDLEFTPRT